MYNWTEKSDCIAENCGGDWWHYFKSKSKNGGLIMGVLCNDDDMYLVHQYDFKNEEHA